MGKQANILSFDEVKRGAGKQRPSGAARNTSARKRSGNSTAGHKVAAASVSRASSYRSSPGSYSGAAGVPSAAARMSGAKGNEPMRSAKSAVSTRAGKVSASTKAAKVGSAAKAGSGQQKAVAAVQATRSRGTVPSWLDADSLSNEEPVKKVAEAEESPEKLSRFAAFRRRHQKDRAGKKFEKQFGGTSSTAAEASAGSRAAVYKGEMGASHKRSARMQNEKSSTGTSVAFSPLATLSAWRQSPHFIKFMATLACLLLTAWFLYAPAQQLYQTVRENDRLQAEYAAIEQRNASLEAEVNSLQTASGIEDRAHAQFGWVPDASYQTASVKGLSTTASNGSNFTANIVPGSVEAPQTWYSPFLDAFFGVQ